MKFSKILVIGFLITLIYGCSDAKDECKSPYVSWTVISQGVIIPTEHECPKDQK